jgi:hypothetical protein
MLQLPQEIVDVFVVDTPGLRRTCRELLRAHTRLFDLIVAKHGSLYSMGHSGTNHWDCLYSLWIPVSEFTFVSEYDNLWNLEMFSDHKLVSEKQDAVNGVTYTVVTYYREVEEISKVDAARARPQRVAGAFIHRQLVELLMGVKLKFAIYKMLECDSKEIYVVYQIFRGSVHLVEPYPEIVDGQLDTPAGVLAIGAAIDQWKLVEYMCNGSSFDSARLGFLEHLARIAVEKYPGS